MHPKSSVILIFSLLLAHYKNSPQLVCPSQCMKITARMEFRVTMDIKGTRNKAFIENAYILRYSEPTDMLRKRDFKKQGLKYYFLAQRMFVPVTAAFYWATS